MNRYTPLRRAALIAALVASGIVAAFATIGEVPDAGLLLPKSALLEPLPIPLEDSLLPSPATYMREERFQRGETLTALLARLEIGEADAGTLQRQLHMRQLRPGTTVTAEVGADGSLVALGFLVPRELLIRIERDSQGLRATEERAPLASHLTLKSAEIRSSLFAAADESAIPDAVALQLADIFGGDIDFHRDLRKGDRFSVVYEVQTLAGRPVRSGRVLGAEFLNQGKAYRALWFAGAGGKGGYYAPEGKNLRKAFLRSPLEFSRVSSGFGMRKHPLFSTWRAHAGVDYAAPAGTRVRAVGGGVVHFAGRNGGYGNVVIVRHAGRHSTLYAHLRGFARGILKGVRVAQGETIGYVGQTGWATGPHLHYEFRVGAEARNPLRIALPAALPVPAHEMGAFRALAAPLNAQLDLLGQGSIALFE